MLTGSELGLAIAAVLFGAVALGALLHWLWARSGSGGSAAERLHEAELGRETAEQALQEAETRHARREEDLRRELAEARADLETMNDGLVNARKRLMELEIELERLRGPDSGQ